MWPTWIDEEIDDVIAWFTGSYARRHAAARRRVKRALRYGLPAARLIEKMDRAGCPWRGL